MKYTFLVFITCIIGLSGQAQDTIKKNTLSLHWGVGYIARQDLIFSPFIHTDFTPINFGLEYKREASLFQQVHVNYANYNPMVAKPYEFTEYGEPIKAYPHSFNFIDLDYLIGKKIQETEKTSLTVGGLFSADVQAMNYVYGRFSNLGYFATFGLGVFAREKFIINKKSHLTATLQVPLFAWLARSPYLVNDDQFIENISSHSGFKSFMAFIGDGQLATWNRLQMFDLKVQYTYIINEKWEVGTAYAFEFIHSSRPRNLLSYRNALYLSANFKF